MKSKSRQHGRQRDTVGLAFVFGVGIWLLLVPTLLPAATITVNDVGDTAIDDGLCTLREAITSASNNTVSGAMAGECAAGSGSDIIAFEIPGAGPHTIQPTVALPVISAPVLIDGTTQTGADCSTNTLQIELDGQRFLGVDGLTVTGGGSTVRGLVIHSFGVGINLQTNGGNTIECNIIGGAVDLGNFTGILIDHAPNNTIGGASNFTGNLISGNFGDGILISGAGATGNKILGNLIGTDSSGTEIVLNFSGISISGAARNTIGGVSDEARNLISGNLTNGVTVDGSGATGNVVLGNYIGTDVTGREALGNGFSGVSVGVAASNTTVGGPLPEAGNLIVGNLGGIVLRSEDNTVVGNRIENNRFAGMDLRESGSLTSNTGNCITGNSSGMINTTGVATVADGIWWGHFTGPGGEAPGLGDSIGTDVLVTTFATTPFSGCQTLEAGAVASVGSEFEVGLGSGPAAAFDIAGNLLVVWQNEVRDIAGRRFNSSGDFISDEFQINTSEPRTRSKPDVAFDTSSLSFLVVWEGDPNGDGPDGDGPDGDGPDSDGPDSDGPDIYGQRLDGTGTRLGSEFRLNTSTVGIQTLPKVAADGQGRFVVTWAGETASGSYDHTVRRFSNSGAALGSELRFGDSGNKPTPPALDSGGAGEFMIAWEDLLEDISAQRFGRSGMPLGSDFRVNSATVPASQPAITADAFGGHTVAWRNEGQFGADGGISAARFGRGGMPLGSDFLVSSAADSAPSYPGVATDLPSGQFVVTWESGGEQAEEERGIFGQLFASSGVAMGDEFAVESTADGDMAQPAIAFSSPGRFVVAWENQSLIDVRGQNFEILDCVPSATTLCIDDQPGDRRFRITLHFDTDLGGGSEGDAMATPLTSLGIGDGGVLSFFTRDNPEVLIKVLDGCSINNRFWVFYAAATSVGFTLTVDDSIAGIQQVYTNRDGEAATTVTDTSAFDTCDVSTNERDGVTLLRPGTPLSDRFPDFGDSPSDTGAGNCEAGATTLCIDNEPGDRRFKVTLHFATDIGSGSEGDALASSLAPLDIKDGGVLSFFSADNPEVLIKVLNGCDINDRFWVFYAAATTVGFTLTVEDTRTGVEQRYTNPDGDPAATITDTNAFASCP